MLITKTSPYVPPYISSCTFYLIDIIEKLGVSQEKNNMRRLEGEFYDFVHRVTTNYWTYWWEKQMPTYFISDIEVWDRNAHISTSVRCYLHIDFMWNYLSLGFSPSLTCFYPLNQVVSLGSMSFSTQYTGL